MSPTRFFLACACLLAPGAASAQALSIPSEVDYGASGLVQFHYRCPDGAACRARCHSRGTLVADREGVSEVLMTAFRTHGRQNSPDYEVQIKRRSESEPAQTVVLFGDGNACTLDGMVIARSSGFLSRTRRDVNSR